MTDIKNNKSKQKKKEKEKSVFHKTSAAGKGDVPRINISIREWDEKSEKIFRPKEKENELYKNER